MAMCTDTSSSRGIVSPRFGNLARAATNLWVTSSSCTTTASTTAPTSLKLASPKPCNLISRMGFLSLVSDLGTMTFEGRLSSQVTLCPKNASLHIFVGTTAFLVMSKVRQTQVGHMWWLIFKAILSLFSQLSHLERTH